MGERKSFVFLDKTYIHTGQKRLYENWDFVTRIEEEQGIPINWEYPVNYKEGTYEVEFTILEMGPVGSPLAFAFGWWNTEGDEEIRHVASPAMTFSIPSTYKMGGLVKDLRKWYGMGPREDEPCDVWYWDSAFANKTLYTLIQARKNNPGEDGFPIKLHVKVTIYEKE